jgi:hypothetical protein
MTLPEPRTRWVVGLSDGMIVTEGYGIAKREKGKLSPWHALQSFIEKTGERITFLGIRVGDQHFNLPSVNSPNGSELPVKYNHFRYYASDFSPGAGVEHLSCAEAVYPDYTVRLWVSEFDTNKCWVTVVNN